MVYRVIGVLHRYNHVRISFSSIHENAGKWNYEILFTNSVSIQHDLPASDTALEKIVSEFIEQNNLHFKISMIAFHGDSDTGCFAGPKLAAATGLPVISELPAIDISLGGNGEFMKPVLEKLITDQPVENKEHEGITETVAVAVMGILRWREEYNFLSSNTGASRNSIGGALWLGQEA